MKKRVKYKIPHVAAQEVAENLKKGMGKERAFKLADSLVKTLHNTSVADVNVELYDLKDIRQQEQEWLHIRGILAK